MAKSSGKAKTAAESGEKRSVMGYFRKIYAARPHLLRTRSNEEIIEQWLADHPGHTEIPKSVRNTLANLKSLLRKKLRAVSHVNHDGQPPTSPNGSVSSLLDKLEMMIDDALSCAKSMDPVVGLANVVNLLRRARNEVVLKIGQ